VDYLSKMAHRNVPYLPLLLVLASFLGLANGMTTECTKEIWGDNTIRFTCPMVGQSQDMVFCCGKSDNQYCCNGQELLSIATIVGIIIAAVALLVIVTLVCCCCCSCCLLAKRRERRGVVLVPSKPPDSNTQVFIPPQQNYVMSANQNPPYPTQASYPMQQTASYPSAPPSDHGVGYPMAPQQDQYPGGPGFKYGAQPPPYSAN
jgi:hypothetical protein